MEDNDEIFILSDKHKIRIGLCFSFTSLPKYVASASEKASPGLKAPSDSSPSSVSLFKLNPRPVHVMSQLDWLSLTPSPPFVMGSQPAMVEQFTSVRGEKEFVGTR